MQKHDFKNLNDVDRASCKYTRIVGGRESHIENFPYIAAIKFIDTNLLHCAGSIISNQHILTAAHCFYGQEELYELLRLNETIEFNRFQKKINLPTEDVHDILDVILWGWGVTANPIGYFSDKLRQVTVEILNYDECVKVFTHSISEDQICTQTPRKNASIGDSGGPVTSNDKLIGIISFNMPSYDVCPEIHCNIFKHLDFITAMMNI
ncbi:PREDICTED: hypodermin-A-like [Ceratosolen solmsi marchali]|uniref:Hypodermin-A-like n=1 Tax=Ceratosolen solmsi marchali TaxID=326594 RepID=A0AAJ7E1U9_9HYME|nr:PREDICTED: hypodermin-A-like [Ceratosolen solmsi marchali]